MAKRHDFFERFSVGLFSQNVLLQVMDEQSRDTAQGDTDSAPSPDMDFIWWGCAATGTDPGPTDGPTDTAMGASTAQRGWHFLQRLDAIKGCKIMHVDTSELCKNKQTKKSAYTIHCLKTTFLTFSWIMVFSLLEWTRIHCSSSEARASSLNACSPKPLLLFSLCLYWL